jgi:hypothetical protein
VTLNPTSQPKISGFLYAQFYATPVKGTRFGIFALGECPRWRHRIVADLVLSSSPVEGVKGVESRGQQYGENERQRKKLRDGE